MSSLRFRNVDADPDDEVSTWPYEALVTAIDRGSLPDWRRVIEEIRRAPHGQVAQRIDRFLAYRPADAVSTLFSLAIERARAAEAR